MKKTCPMCCINCLFDFLKDCSPDEFFDLLSSDSAFYEMVSRIQSLNHSDLKDG